MAALVAVPLFYRQIFCRVDETIRTHVEAKIAARFPNLSVHVRSAQLVADGIEVRGLSIVEPGAMGPQAELLFVDEVLLVCETSLQELMRGDPKISSAKMIRPVLSNTRRPDGTWSLAKLLPLPESKNFAPKGTIENGRIVVFDPLKNPSSTFTFRDINLQCKRTEDSATGQVTYNSEGYLAADQIQRVELAATFDKDHGRWSMSGTVDGLEISAELRDSLPEAVAMRMEPLGTLRGRADFSFKLSGDDSERSPRFEIHGTLAGGRLEDARLPYPLADIQANVHCDNAGLQIHELTARHGPTMWHVAQFDRRGYDSQSPFVVRASGKQVRLDREWGKTLSEPWRTDWMNYDPEGNVDLECTVEYDGQQWKPTLKATCLNNVSFSCHRFPYRLERAQGTLVLADNVLTVNVTAFSGPQPVTLNGRFLNPGPQFTGMLEIRGDEIQFDEKLFAALLKPKAQQSVRELNPRGTFNFYARVHRDDPRVREMHQHVEIYLNRGNRCSVNYKKFPYELKSVQGTLVMEDGQWTFPELKATHSTGLFTGGGNLATSPQDDVLRLAIEATNVPLDEELRDALQPSQQQLWSSLRPRGSVDLHTEIRYDSRVKQIGIELRAYPRDDATSGSSIEPVAFPYRMEKLHGMIHYRDGHVDLKNISAVHRATQMRTNGSCDLAADGGWRLHLEDLSFNGLRLQLEDRELVDALPEAIKRAVAELRPTGPIHLKGAMDFAKPAVNAPLQASWDVDLFLHQGSLQAGPKLENIFGRARLTGSSDGARFTSRGELDLDSLTYKNIQFTDVKGPFWFDNRTAVFGDWPQSRQAGKPNSRVTAKCLGGIASGECSVQLGAMPLYHLSATISQADLREFARDNLGNRQDLKGKILANIDLHGRRGLQNLSLFGSGNIHLTDADVYELPVMVALLKVVRAKRPDTRAFTQSDIAFAVRGQHIVLQQIALNGDAINLSGDGELTLDGQTNPIKLTLHTTVGRGKLPLLNGMLSEASQQILKINVDGNLDHVTTTTVVLPAANEALQQLKGDYEQPPQTGTLTRNGTARR